MPQLRETDNPENFKKIILPSTQHLTGEDQAWVIMDLSPVITADILDASPDTNPTKMSALMLTRRIKEWNFTNPDKSPIPILYENVARLEIEDLRWLASKIETAKPLTDEQKKTSSSISVTAPEGSTTTSGTTPSQ